MALRLGDTAPDFTAQTTAARSASHDWIGESSDSDKVVTPVTWTPGEDVIIAPAASDAEAKERFPLGWRALEPSLRLTPQPDRPRPSEALR